MYLLHGGQLLLEVVQFLQQLPLLQQVVLGQVERRVQQVHHVLHVLQLHGVLAGRAHWVGAAEGWKKRIEEEEREKSRASDDEWWTSVAVMAEVRETGGRTLFWRANVVNCVIDDELEVLLQQGVDQRGVRDALSVCRQHKRKLFFF